MNVAALLLGLVGKPKLTVMKIGIAIVLLIILVRVVLL